MRIAVLALGATMLSSMTVSAQTPFDPAAAFGAREFVQNVSLSPDGTKYSMILAGPGRSAVLVVGDAVKGGPPKRLTTATGDRDTLRYCDWATANRLVCMLAIESDASGTRLTFSRLFAINADGTGIKMLSAQDSSTALDIRQNGGSLIDWGSDDDSGTVLMTRQFVPEMSTGTLVAEKRRGLGVERVDTVSLQRRIVEQPRDNAVEYISDGYGTVRIMGLRPQDSTGYDGSRIAYFYRREGSREWEKLGDLALQAQSSSGFDPIRVDRTANVVYGYDKLDGRKALYRISLDGSLKKELVLSRPDVDVDGLVTFGRHRHVVGASYATDKRTVEYFDPTVKSMRDALARAMKGKAISISDATSDEGRMLVFTGSDIDPGRYYLYTKAARKMEELLPVRPQLDGQTLASVRPIAYPARDGTRVPGYLTLPPGVADAKGLPAIVMPHGGPGSRDEWGFDWLSQFFAARGYAVLQPNFRGSTGYGDAWFQKNGFQSWRTAIGDVNDAGRWLIAQGIADPSKLAVFGWSYGGYAALQSPALEPNLFKSIVAVAPVTDLDTLREESRGYSNFPLIDAFIGHGVHVREGSPARNAGAITAPVLLFHGTRDRNVGVGESRLMASRLKGAGKKVEYVEFAGLDHYLDDPAARTRLLKDSDRFLRETLGIK